MIFSNCEDIVYLKDSEKLLHKINRIKSVLQELDCKIETIPAPMSLENNEISFNFEVTFKFP